MAESVLGYDVRWHPSRLAPVWDPARRARFLLRVVAAPLSVDLVVWPSVFDYGVGIGLPPAERAWWLLVGLAPPAWTGPNVGLWDDATALRAAQPDAALPTVRVAVTSYRARVGYLAPPRHEACQTGARPTRVPAECNQ